MGLHHDHHGHHSHDHHGHGHSHHHGGHHHGAVKNIKLAFFLNLAFTLLEIFGGLFTNSIAILSDALHDLGDSISLGLAWYLEGISARDSDRSYSYGYARFSVLGALINSVILIVGAIFVLQNAIPRLIHPQSSDASGMIVFSLIGIGVNGLAALRLQKGATLNERVVALHLLEDVLGWVAILIGSIVMLFADLPILDPILSIAIMAYVLSNVFRNLNQALRIFLQGTPKKFNPHQVKAELVKLDGVKEIHDLHIWTLDGQLNVATLHVVVEEEALSLKSTESIKIAVRNKLAEIDIEHATIEIEDKDADCGMEACDDREI